MRRYTYSLTRCHLLAIVPTISKVEVANRSSQAGSSSEVEICMSLHKWSISMSVPKSGNSRDSNINLNVLARIGILFDSGIEEFSWLVLMLEAAIYLHPQ